MMLIGVLLLGAFCASDVAANPPPEIALENRAEMDQDLEKRDTLNEGICRGGLAYFGRCYKFFPEQKNWIDAELHCQTLAPGSHLASIHWESQGEFIGRMISKSKRTIVETWIGLNDVYKEKTFLWIDGSPTDFTKWAPKQPDNTRTNEDCVHIGIRFNSQI
ncbi:lectin-like [Cetorhinus maximus]